MPSKIEQDSFNDLEIDVFPTQDDSWLDNVPKTQEKNEETGLIGGQKKSGIPYFQAPNFYFFFVYKNIIYKLFEKQLLWRTRRTSNLCALCR